MPTAELADEAVELLTAGVRSDWPLMSFFLLFTVVAVVLVASVSVASAVVKLSIWRASPAARSLSVFPLAFSSFALRDGAGFRCVWGARADAICDWYMSDNDKIQKRESMCDWFRLLFGWSLSQSRIQSGSIEWDARLRCRIITLRY